MSLESAAVWMICSGVGAAVRIFVQARLDQAAQIVVLAGQGPWVGRFVHDAVEHVAAAALAEWRDAGGRVGQDGAEGEHVRGRPCLAAGGKFRGGVAGGADHHAGSGQGTAVQGPGDPEVDDLRPVLVQQDVAGLQVPVHDAGGVDRRQGLGDPAGQGEHHRFGQRPATVDALGERRAGDVGGGDPGTFRVSVGVDHGRGVPALDGACGDQLAGEAAAKERVAGQLRLDELDRHRPPGGTRGQIHLAHRPAAETSDEVEGAHAPRIVPAQRLDRRQLAQQRWVRRGFCVGGLPCRRGGFAWAGRGGFFGPLGIVDLSVRGSVMPECRWLYGLLGEQAGMRRAQQRGQLCPAFGPGVLVPAARRHVRQRHIPGRQTLTGGCIRERGRGEAREPLEPPVRRRACGPAQSP